MQHDLCVWEETSCGSCQSFCMTFTLPDAHVRQVMNAENAEYLLGDSPWRNTMCDVIIWVIHHPANHHGDPAHYIHCSTKNTMYNHSGILNLHSKYLMFVTFNRVIARMQTVQFTVLIILFNFSPTWSCVSLPRPTTPNYLYVFSCFWYVLYTRITTSTRYRPNTSLFKKPKFPPTSSCVSLPQPTTSSDWKYSYVFNLRSNICKAWCLNIHFISNDCNLIC